MKRILKLFILVFMILIIFMQPVKATSPDEIADRLYEMGWPYGMTEGDKVKIERYISQYGLTDEQSNAIMTKANEALSILKQYGTENIPMDQLNKLKEIAIETADIVGAKIIFTSKKTADIYVDGVKFDSVNLHSVSTNPINGATDTKNGAKLVYTGNNYNSVLIFSSIATTILVSAIILRKKIVHA